MKLVEKIFALKKIHPFDRIKDNELTLISEVAQVKEFNNGEIIAGKDKTINRLYVIIDGEVLDPENRAVNPVIGVKSLLFNTPFPSDLRASDDRGAVSLWITNGHFFTIVHECPEMVLGFLEMPDLL